MSGPDIDTDTGLSIRRAALDGPDRPGLVYEGRTYTFAELGARASHKAGRLDMLGTPGTERDSRAAVLVAERTIDTAVAIYAALDTRTPLILMHPRATERERAGLMRLVESELAPDRELAFVLFTSGSSGRPKGVLLDRRAFVASAAASAAHLGWHPDDRWLCCLPLAHIGGLSILSRCLIARRCTVLHRPGRFDPHQVADLIERERVTLLSLVPTMLDALLHAGWTVPGHVRAALLGGASAPGSLLAAARARGVPVLPTYGMTETCSQVCTRPVDTNPDTPEVSSLPLGPPLSGVELRVRAGRIQVRGPMLFRGYLGAAAAVDSEGWFDTGDRGRIDDSGALHVFGRDDDTIITGGENVHPAEVEDVLCTYPGIVAACVFGVFDTRWGEIVAAALVCDEAARLALADLDSFLARRLAAYKRPRLVCELNELPLGPTGKIDRQGVAALAAGRLGPLRRP